MSFTSPTDGLVVTTPSTMLLSKTEDGKTWTDMTSKLLAPAGGDLRDLVPSRWSRSASGMQNPTLEAAG